MTEIISKLCEDHNTRDFSCGEEALDRFIAEHALENQHSGYGRTWVATLPDSRPVLGFYTLCAAEISFASAPPKLIRGMPRYPVPCFLLARLAVSTTNQGTGLGRRLVADTLRRCAASGVGAKCIVVDAKNTRAVAFYSRLGFIAFPDTPMKLLIKMSTVEKTLR